MDENSSLVATLVAIPPALTIGDPLSATVVINALSPLSIETDTEMLNVMEGGRSTDIRVSLNRIESDREDVTVTVTIKPEGSGLTVSSPLLTFRTTVAQTVTVEVPSDNLYTGNRDVTLTFEADDYPPAIGGGKYPRKHPATGYRLKGNANRNRHAESGEIYDEYGDRSECCS